MLDIQNGRFTPAPRTVSGNHGSARPRSPGGVAEVVPCCRLLRARSAGGGSHRRWTPGRRQCGGAPPKTITARGIPWCAPLYCCARSPGRRLAWRAELCLRSVPMAPRAPAHDRLLATSWAHRQSHSTRGRQSVWAIRRRRSSRHRRTRRSTLPRRPTAHTNHRPLCCDKSCRRRAEFLTICVKASSPYATHPMGV